MAIRDAVLTLIQVPDFDAMERQRMARVLGNSKELSEVFKYRVVQAKNTIRFTIGQELTAQQIEDLPANVTFTVKESKA